MKNKKIRSFFNFLLLFSFTALVLYFSLKDNYEQIMTQILHMNPLFLAGAFLLVLLYWFFRIITVHNLARSFLPKYTIREASCLVVETNFFHAVTPFSSGGQPYEIYSLKKSGMKLTEATNVSIQNFIVYQIALVLLGIIAIISNYFLHLFPANPLFQKLVTLGFVINTLVIIILFMVTFGSRVNQKILESMIHMLGKLKLIKNPEDKIVDFSKYIGEFHEGAKILLADKFNFIKLILLQLVSLCSLYLVPLMLFYAAGKFDACNPFNAIVTSAYVMLIGSFVPIPGGTGGLEYGFVQFYSNFISSGLVMAIMLVWRFVTYYFGMIVGGIVLAFRKK